MKEGRKDDTGKIDWALLVPSVTEKILEVFMFGAGKYGRDNYKAGMDWSRVYSALMRHMTAWWDGEDLDPETSKSHLAHAGCCIMMLLYYVIFKKGKDDRFKEEKKK